MIANWKSCPPRSLIFTTTTCLHLLMLTNIENHVNKRNLLTLWKLCGKLDHQYALMALENELEMHLII